MIVHPSRERLETFEGTRLLKNSFGLAGAVLYDPEDTGRIWTVVAMYLPIKRSVSGVRAKCIDQKGFTTFINQRDLEVVLGMVKPGDWCRWLGTEYPEPGMSSFYGFCMDSDDILDDLYDKELIIRAAQAEVMGCMVPIPRHTEVEQYIHYSKHNDAIRRCLYTMDSDDPRMETLTKRVTVYETERVEWWKL